MTPSLKFCTAIFLALRGKNWLKNNLAVQHSKNFVSYNSEYFMFHTIVNTLYLRGCRELRFHITNT